MKSIKRREYIGFVRIYSSPPRSLLEKWRGQWGVQQTTAKLANLSLMFAALSCAEFQGNGFSAVEHKRVSVEKTFHFWTKLFELFYDNGKASCAHDNRALVLLATWRRIRRCYDLDMHRSFCLFSTWQERICPTHCQEKCSSMESGEEWAWPVKRLWNCKLEQKRCPYQLQVLLSLWFLASVFMSLFVAQNVPAVELTSN